jgi:DNA topoisomerase-1
MKLLIVESPSKCKKIEEYLGSGYKCIATKGHFRSLKNLKSINTKTFFPSFQIDETKMDTVTKIRPIIESYNSSDILLATDDDREGEAIAWHICQVFNLPLTTPRIIFHEITKHALLEAVKSPTKINMNLVFSQHSRQILDMIVGFKVSPFLWKYLYGNKTKSLSAGRCQTPALRLVYENEKSKSDEIETKYKTSAFFFESLYKFELNHDYILETEMIDFLEKSLIFNDHKLCITQKTESIHNAPRPFNTSSLLQCVSNSLHYSPKYTMKLCQELYQKGHITYMRTDNTKYSPVFIKEVSDYIQCTFGESYIGDISQVEENIKGINLAHEAIRVTHLNTINVNDEKCNALYLLIRKNTIESCMSTAKYDISQIKIDAPDDKKYIYTIEIPKYLGWKRYSISLLQETEIQKCETAKLFFFQTLNPQCVIYPNHIESLVSINKKHQHYTEASLIKQLEKLGIGRPSTYSMIVETIQERGYVLKQDIKGEKLTCDEYKVHGGKIVKTSREKIFGNEKNKLLITPVGILTIEFLLSHFEELFSYKYTQKMESSLEEMFLGEEEEVLESKREKICKDCYDYVKTLSKPLLGIEKKTYPIGDSGYDLVFQQFGASLKRVLGDGTIEYKTVKKGLSIDLQRLSKGEYNLDELIEIKEDILGEYEGKEMKIKTGMYGPYVEWDSLRESIKSIKKPLNEISLNDVVEMLESKKGVEVDGNTSRNRPKMPTVKTTGPNILKSITNDLSVRKNVKTGEPYIYYMKKGMTKPRFFSLQKYKDTYLECDVKVLKEWIFQTYIRKK